MATADYLGMTMLEDCVEHMATAAESPTKRRSQKRLLDEPADSDENMEELAKGSAAKAVVAARFGCFIFGPVEISS